VGRFRDKAFGVPEFFSSRNFVNSVKDYLIGKLDMQKRKLVIRISNKEDEAATRIFWLDKTPEETPRSC